MTEEGERRPSGWYMDTALDFSGEDSWLAYVYFVYKWLFAPRLESDSRIEEFFACQNLDFRKESGNETGVVSKVSFAAVGDLMSRRGFDQGDPSHLYSDIEDSLFGADVVFGNLETPAHPERPITYFPRFNLSADATRIYLGADREHGFDVVSTANNHVMDQGEEGLLATLDHLDRLGIAHVGSSRSADERDNEFPVIEVKGIRTAFLAYTASTNWRSIPAGREHQVNLVRLNTMGPEPDMGLIERHIRTARERAADVIVVSLHWGHDFEFYPSRRIIERAHRIIDMGADIIVGHHPHILGPLERYVPDERAVGTPEALIAYSLGNLIPDSRKAEYRTSAILRFTIGRDTTKDGSRVRVQDVDFTPVYWFCGRNKSKRDFRLIDIERAIASGPDGSKYTFLKRSDWKRIDRAQRLVRERFEPRTWRQRSRFEGA